MATKGRNVLFSMILVAAAQPVSADSIDAPATDPITVTASREAVPVALSGTALTVIDRATIDALALPLVKDYLTLVPGVAVAQTGPLGAQTQVRIRGAEANHSITFIDGIEVTDPASSGEFRYETLLAHGVDRIEVLRGPQSALWGSQAVGGVINILTRSAPKEGSEAYGEAQAGSLGTVRAGIGGGWGRDTTQIAGQASWLSSRGYDIAGGDGDRDGYENLTLHLKARTEPTANTHIAAVARYVTSNSEFDDFDYGAGVPLDAGFATRTRQLALRGEAGLRLLDDRWTHLASITHTDAANINRTDGDFQNRSDGGRTLYRYQTSLRFDAGDWRQRFTAALEHERERFTSADADAAALSNQSRSRLQTSLVGEYRLDWQDVLGGGVAVRRDWNNRFADATTVRANLAIRPGAGFTLHGSFGTGIADPTFFDLFGFFPGFFVGNPNLRPERSRSFDAGLGWSDGTTALDATWFDATLDDEIVSTFDSATFLSGVANATGHSRRQGLELSASTSPVKGLTLAATYTYLDADQQQVAAGLRLREVRRPRHSGSVTASYAGGAFDLAASAAIVGDRGDTDFARFVPVTLPAYTLVTLSGAIHLTPRIDLTGRIENALDARQEDVFAYRGPGLTAHAGVRFRL